jgi:hypothetical protein
MGSYPKRLQLYLSDELFNLALNEAKARGVTIASVVRNALTEYLKKEEGVGTEDPIWKVAEICSTYDSHSPGDLSSKHDEYLYGKKS